MLRKSQSLQEQCVSRGAGLRDITKLKHSNPLPLSEAASMAAVHTSSEEGRRRVDADLVLPEGVLLLLSGPVSKLAGPLGFHGGLAGLHLLPQLGGGGGMQGILLQQPAALPCLKFQGLDTGRHCHISQEGEEGGGGGAREGEGGRGGGEGKKREAEEGLYMLLPGNKAANSWELHVFILHSLFVRVKGPTNFARVTGPAMTFDQCSARGQPCPP